LGPAAADRFRDLGGRQIASASAVSPVVAAVSAVVSAVVAAVFAPVASSVNPVGDHGCTAHQGCGPA
jgi:hypothetical protein